MKQDFYIIKKCPLFADINMQEIEILLKCLNIRERKIKKDELIFTAGDNLEYIGIVLSGSVYIVQEDYWGNRTIVASIDQGGIFGEAFSCAQIQSIPVSVIAHTDGSILLIDCQKILTPCPCSCLYHTSLISNLMKVLANKNIALTRKMKHITKKTTREKVLSYLSECAVSFGKNYFEIPFNRQELADYLSVERSALSNTLCKMRDEGIIEFHKNKFHIL